MGLLAELCRAGRALEQARIEGVLRDLDNLYPSASGWLKVGVGRVEEVILGLWGKCARND
ncbi:MAG: hypothetical protein A3G24_12055 [Betaproteobacteria bacterium RIFCSPLOWO2_12_FULL_62_13]|nr:MAG: hypothetical protein A3G24_12055 [Betaproteobacteria bacterium RIFCSPLOWO2_12_FULL_62_13]